MPTLNWEGKESVINYHEELPIHTLEHVPELSCGPDDSGNLIVHGDNLYALNALLPRYAGKVKCIYIDPPYNTGKGSWAYNDNTDSPEIREWLNAAVGKVASRRDRWLSMMYPRLVLLQQFLREDGAIFVSISDNEVATLRLLMDDIFGYKNFIATIIWNMVSSTRNNTRHFSKDHEYIIIYAYDKKKWRANLLPRSERRISRYKNPDNDPRGPWVKSDVTAPNFNPRCAYPITTPSGRVISGPPSGSCWRISMDKLRELDDDNRIWWGKTGGNIPGIKRFLAEVRNGVVSRTLWTWQEVGSTQQSKKEISRIFNLGRSSNLFETPKPTALIQRIIQTATDHDSLVLDSFAGSGTTGHAVLKQNAEDGGNRKFILVEMDETIASNVTSERVKRVATGYTSEKGNVVDGLGGGFQFHRVNEGLINEAHLSAGQRHRQAGRGQGPQA